MGNGKVERVIRTITERLRTNKRIVLQKGNTELSEVLYTLRSTPKENKKTPAELQIGREVTTVKDIITTQPQTNYNVSELDYNLELNGRLPCKPRFGNPSQRKDEGLQTRKRLQKKEGEDHKGNPTNNHTTRTQYTGENNLQRKGYCTSKMTG